MSFVRTVLGDIEPSQMGVTYSHEHIVIEESFPVLQNPDFLLNDTTKISAELKAVYMAGGRTMVDTMPAACGRNVMKLAEVSAAVGNTNHCAYGYSSAHLLSTPSLAILSVEEQLTQLFIDDRRDRY
jgi:phosphotriesterase-related protein